MSTYEQAVAYSFPDDPGVTLTFTPLDSILINAAGEIIPKTARTALTTAGTIDLPVPDGTGRGAWRWSVSLPDAELGIFELGHHVGTAQLATLLATYNERTAVSPNVLAQLIAKYYSLSNAQIDWLVAALTSVPDAADLIPDAPADGTQYGRQDGAWAAISAVSDVGDLTTAGLTAANMLRVAVAGGLEERTPAQVRSDIGAETAGAAASAQAYAVQRANHTGTQPLSTISDAGTMAAQAATNYYAKADFSAAPTAAEPIKADGSGGVQTKKLAVGAAQHTGSVVSAHYNAGASLAFFVRESDGKVFWAAPGGFALGGGAYPLSMAWGTNGSITNSSGNLLMYNTAAAAVRIRTTNIDTLVLAADGGATFTPHTASEIGIVVSLAGAATANALEVRSSVGTVLAKIEPDGEIQAAGYRSSDGSAGWTGTFTNGDGATVTVKNGLITGVA